MEKSILLGAFSREEKIANAGFERTRDSKYSYDDRAKEIWNTLKNTMVVGLFGEKALKSAEKFEESIKLIDGGLIIPDIQ